MKVISFLDDIGEFLDVGTSVLERLLKLCNITFSKGLNDIVKPFKIGANKTVDDLDRKSTV